MYRLYGLDQVPEENDGHIASYLRVMDLYQKGSLIINGSDQSVFLNDTFRSQLGSYPAVIESFVTRVLSVTPGTNLLFEQQLESESIRLRIKYWCRKIDPLKKEKLLLCLVENVEFERLDDEFSDIVGDSDAIRRVKDKIGKVAKSDSVVLLIGETGTGKEVFARALHRISDRRDKRLVVINCGAIPDTLLESELFGYEEGAFTGARKKGKIGLIEAANGGTVFLDEIENMSPYMQNKLLRVLEDKHFYRVGGNEQITVDIRIVGATNIDLLQLVEQGAFRKDLFYRLSVITIRIPSLRERKSDIIMLSNHFIEQFNQTMGKNVKGLSTKVKELFMNYDWEGNVRELKNVIEYAMTFEENQYISVNSLPEYLCNLQGEGFAGNGHLIKPLEVLEKEAIEQALNYYGWDERGKLMAAQALGISRSSIYRKIAKYF